MRSESGFCLQDPDVLRATRQLLLNQQMPAPAENHIPQGHDIDDAVTCPIFPAMADRPPGTAPCLRRPRPTQLLGSRTPASACPQHRRRPTPRRTQAPRPHPRPPRPAASRAKFRSFRVAGHSPGTGLVIAILSGRKAATTRSKTTIHKHLSNPLSDPHRVSAVSPPP